MGFPGGGLLSEFIISCYDLHPGEGIDLVVRTFIANVLIGLSLGILLYVGVGHV